MGTIPTYADNAKTVVAHIAPILKKNAFRKRRNAFNRRLENGLVHHVSIRLMSAMGSLHAKFALEAGCRVPEVELYSQTDPDPKWVSIYHCSIMEHFVATGSTSVAYLDAALHAKEPTRIEPYLSQALSALENVRSYDQIMSDTHDIAPLKFVAPRGIQQTCIALSRNDKAKAKRILKGYLDARKNEGKAGDGHAEHVREWGEAHGLL